MPEALDIGELHSPGQIGDCSEYLPVDEITYPAEAEDDCGRNSKNIKQGPKRNLIDHAEYRNTCRPAEYKPVRGKTSDPDTRDQCKVIAIEFPFII